MNKALIVACLAVVPGAAFSTAQMLKPKVTLNESWLLERVPSSVPGYKLEPGKDGPKVTYRMDETTYRELEPVGIAAQVFLDPGGRAFEAVVIAGQDMSTFHDQRVCFIGQGWNLAKNDLGELTGSAFGDVPILDLTVTKAGRSPQPAFFVWRSTKRFTNSRRTAKLDFLWGGLMGDDKQVGFSYRFMGASDGVDTASLRQFATAYLAELKKVEATHP